MRSLGDLLPILFIVVFGLLAKSAQRTALKRQQQGSPNPPQGARKAAAGTEGAVTKAHQAPEATPANLPLTPLESHIMDRRRQDADRIRSPLWDSPSRQKQANGRPQDDANDTQGVAVLPAFSRDALVQAVVLSQVLGPRGGRRAR